LTRSSVSRAPRSLGVLASRRRTVSGSYCIEVGGWPRARPGPISLLLKMLGSAGTRLRHSDSTIHARTSLTASSDSRVESVRMYVMRPVGPSSPSSTPSYRRWARPTVRLGEKRSLLDASCCKREVMKGGGDSCALLALNRATRRVACDQQGHDLAGLAFVREHGLLALQPDQRAAAKGGGALLPPAPRWSSTPRDGKALTLGLAIHHQTHGHRLHPARRQTAPHLGPQHRADLVAHQPVEHAPRLCDSNLCMSSSRG